MSASQTPKSAIVLVLGDIGRSPRMQYHSACLARNGFKVDFVGYNETRPPAHISSNKNILFRYISTPPKIPSWLDDKPPIGKLCYIIYAPIKVLFQIFVLLYVLAWQCQRAEYIVVQNPPAIPTLMIVQIISYLRNSKLIIDWHNLGYTILSLSLGNRHLFVKLAKWLEMTFGRKAYGHICVTEAMLEWLEKEWGIEGNATVLYDRPASHFRRLDIAEIHSFMNLLAAKFHSSYPQIFLPPSTTSAADAKIQSTLITESHNIQQSHSHSSEDEPRKFIFRANRPILIVSSTSWTEDEDFSLLLNALVLLDAMQSAKHKSSKFVFLITGKGPKRPDFEKSMESLRLNHINVATMWLSSEEYAKLLGSADLGISLHTSSSGLDLPMKVLDMFGSGMPVCAIGFKCLKELIKHDENSLIFFTAQELAHHINDLFESFPHPSSRLNRFRQRITNSFGNDDDKWEQQWQRVVGGWFK